jgi:hypothetical protein
MHEETVLKEAASNSHEQKIVRFTKINIENIATIQSCELSIF